LRVDGEPRFSWETMNIISKKMKPKNKILII